MLEVVVHPGLYYVRFFSNAETNNLQVFDGLPLTQRLYPTRLIMSVGWVFS